MKKNTIQGVIMTTRGGLGFISHHDFKDDVRIEHEYLNTALNGDTVEVAVQKKKGDNQQRGRVLRIIKRAKSQFVGVLEKENGHWYLKPDARKMYTDILIPEKPSNIPDGHKVLVELLRWDDAAKDPEGKVLDVLGPKGQHEVEMRSILIDKNIDTTFPKDVQDEAHQIQEAWQSNNATVISQALSSNERRDFRDIRTCTIDPVTAKDFDDALSFQKKDNGQIEVGIHIADVSHFVKPSTAIDTEARERGFSTYLVDRTIPMLPEELSNDLCSLNPNTDRLTFSAVFLLDSDSRVVTRWFGRGIIHSDKRFAYEQAQEIIDTNTGTYADMLNTLNTHAQRLRKKRFEEGSIDFATEEVQITLDENNKPTHIERKTLLETNKLIEEFMLLANREVAEKIFRIHGKKDVERAFIYRTHDHPDREKLAQVQSLVRALGYDLGAPGSSVSPHMVNTLFTKIHGTTVEHTIKGALIRAMSKAVYGTKNIGHFGLGFEYYTHFTSPIRRYPDLIVHRVLQKHLQKEAVPKNRFEEHKQLAWNLSQKEILIQEAERDSIKYKQVEYMQEHIGKTFEGIVSGVTKWGLYVEEKETAAEGLIHISNLTKDYFVFDETQYQLRGKKTKKIYRLGDTVRVRVVDTNIDQKTIDFELA